MNKNQRIADALQKLAESLKDAAFNVELIKDILLVKESVQSPMAILTEKPSAEYVTYKPTGPTPTPLSENAGRGTLGQAIVDSNKGKPFTPMSDEDEKFARSMAINREGRRLVDIRLEELEKGEVTPANQSEMTSLITSKRLALVHSNKQTCYYKRITGVHRGSLLSQDRKTQQITDHKYLVTVPLSEQLCLVSNDQDGKDYLNNYVRPSITIRVQTWNSKKGIKRFVRNKLVRYYRPQNENTYGMGRPKKRVKTHCAVYLSDRYWTTKDGMKF